MKLRLKTALLTNEDLPPEDDEKCTPHRYYITRLTSEFLTCLNSLCLRDIDAPRTRGVLNSQYIYTIFPVKFQVNSWKSGLCPASADNGLHAPRVAPPYFGRHICIYIFV